MTHEVSIKPQMKSKKAKEAIESCDKELMWKTLQEYIHAYMEFLKQSKQICAYEVNKEFYDKITVEEIGYQLNIMIGIVYDYEAKHCLAKETIKKCLEQILKSSKKFTRKEIEYLEIGSEVHVDMFDDRMEIYSPGGMVDGTFIQNLNLEQVPSKRRNPVLADVFARLDYMERNGSGIGKIIDACEFAVNYTDEKAPVFYSDRSQFRVTLPNMNYGMDGLESSDGFQSSDPKASKLTKNALEKALENQIIELMKQKPSITQVEIAEQVELSRTKVQSVIKELLKSGRVERMGGRRYGKWVVKA